MRDGVVHAGVHASYLHTHPAAVPDAVVRFVARAADPPRPAIRLASDRH
jgi:cobyrinic acid a,c-diamide synthase